MQGHLLAEPVQLRIRNRTHVRRCPPASLLRVGKDESEIGEHGTVPFAGKLSDMAHNGPHDFTKTQVTRSRGFMSWSTPCLAMLPASC